MTDSFFDLLDREDVEYYKDRALSDFSYVGIGGRAYAVVLPDGIDKTTRILNYLLRSGMRFKVLGNMSNVLVLDEGYNGIVLKTHKMNGYTVADDKVIAMAGVSFIPFVRRMAELSVGGFEPLSGIPGSIGGMICGNAGAYGVEISDLFLYADVFFFEERTLKRVFREEMDFSYRSSILKRRAGMIISAAFKKISRPETEILSDIEGYRQMRKQSQPYGERSLGSVFKRHNGEPVSRMIDLLGLKGFGVGGVRISEKHAGFIVSDKGASARDYIATMNFVKDKIYASYGFIPEEEIEILNE